MHGGYFSVQSRIMKCIGIDYGSKRIGIAFSDEEGTMAFPREVIPNDGKAMQEIAGLVKKEEAALIVIGESKNLDGKENPIFADSERFVQELSKITNIPFHFEPELYTSAEAEQLQGKNDMHDASAAALILKSYLDKQQNNK
jgi:putative holliday junction resolvase